LIVVGDAVLSVPQMLRNRRVGDAGVAFYNVQYRSVGAAISRPRAIDNRPYSDAGRWGQRPLHKGNPPHPLRPMGEGGYT